MCLSSPKIEAPEAPKIEKSIEERKSRVRNQEDERRRAAMAGIQSTILTRPAATAAPTKMGQ